jgi:uncharacterized protein DUF4129
MNDLRTLSPPPGSPQQPRVERLAGWLIVASACTLETLPIFCWLLMLAAYDSGDPNRAAMPFWWMWLLFFCIYWLGVLFLRGTEDDPRRRRMSTLLLTIAVAVLGTLSLLVTYWLSPTAMSVLASAGETGSPVVLALLVAWLWWRGLLLSRGRVTRERMYRRFIVALGVTIAALAGASAVQGEARGLTVSYLALLFAALLFAGTMGLTLAQTRDASYEMRISYRGQQPLSTPPVFTRSWLAASLGLSLGLSLLALLLATLISRESVRILAVATNNIVNGLITGVEFVLTPIFTLIYLILNKPIEWIADFFHRLGPPKPLAIPTPPGACKPTAVVGTPASGVPASSASCAPPPSHAPMTSLLPAEWLTVMRLGTIILVVIVVLVVLARVLSRFTQARRVRAFSDERSMLDAREILSSQLRRFLDTFRRKPPEVAPITDALAPGSVRQVYRDTLAAAADRGRGRRAAETPREYQRRITSDDPLRPGSEPPPGVAGALADLTHAYEQARYGQPDPDASPPATPETVAAADTLRRWLSNPQGE